MNANVDIRTAQFVVEAKGGPSPYRLSWPTDRYYDLVRAPVQVVQMDLSDLTTAARLVAPGFPEAARLAFVMHWFVTAAAGERHDWPSLPVLTRKGGELTFVDGRHRCEALEVLGAARLPVIVG